MMRFLRGKKVVTLSEEELREIRCRYQECLIDVGTGDGLFPYHHAREHPEGLAIGIDPVVDGLQKLAVKAQRKPAKGGAPNLLLAQGAVEGLPAPLAGWADTITVNFPWGSLLRALVEPEPVLLKRLAALGHPGTQITLLINVSIFGNEDYLRRLSLPSLAEARVQEELLPFYRDSGIEISQVQALVGGVPHRTSWGQRLVLGSTRRTLLLSGEIS